MSVNSKMTALADKIRVLSGTEDAMSLDNMASNISEANDEVTSQVELLAQAVAALEGKATGSGGTQVTPVISVNSSTGLITATAGTKSSTHQLAFQPAKTITPSTASQIAVSSGYYTGGNITVAGDTNLVAGNIKSGVSIFGVSGTFSVNNVVDDISQSIIEGEIKTINNDNIVKLGNRALAGQLCLQEVYLNNCSKMVSKEYKGVANVTYKAQAPFESCIALTTVSLPKCTNTTEAAFKNCFKLSSVHIPKCSNISYQCFFGCSSLTSISLPAVININNDAFHDCYNLKSFYLTGSSICTLSNSNAFISTPIGGYSASAGTYGSIYVPASLLTSYKTATNWTYFSSRFVAYDE